MYILRIEHPVKHFDEWKKAFDSDPVNRKKSGVQRYRISRPITDNNYVIVELELNTLEEVQALHNELKLLWNKVTGEIIMNPQVATLEIVENKEIRIDIPAGAE